MKTFIILILGVVFGLGLGISGMTDPAKVSAFLDVAGDWDPSLLIVMGAAVGINFFAYRWANKRKKPSLGVTFHRPDSNGAIDLKLIVGSVLFGAGWGLTGLCPGAALAAIPAATSSIFWFIGAMFVGVVVHDRTVGSPA